MGSLEFSLEEDMDYEGDLIRLNLGCGWNLKSGYTNIDQGDLPSGLKNAPDYVKGNVENLDWIVDETVGEILALDVLQQVRFDRVQETLFEWKRVLVSGGPLVLRFPDFKKVVESFEGGQSDPVLLKEINYAILGYTDERYLVPHRCLLWKDLVHKMLSVIGFQVEDRSVDGDWSTILRAKKKVESYPDQEEGHQETMTGPQPG